MVWADDGRQHVLRRLCLGSEGSEGAPTASDIKPAISKWT